MFKYILFMIIIFTSFSFSNNFNTASIDLSPEEKKLIQSKEIIVSSEYENIPFNFRLGNKNVGYTIDILNLISKKTGLKIKYKNVSNSSEATKLFYDNQIDVLTSLIDLNYIDNVTFSRPYINLDYYVFSNSNFQKFVSLDELSDVNVVVQKGSFWEMFFKQKYPNISLLTSSSLDESIQKVLTNEADFTILNNIAYNYYKEKYKIKNIEIKKIENSIRDLLAQGYHFTLKKEDVVLKNIIDKAIKSITLEEIKQIDKKWFSAVDESNSFNQKINLSILEKNYLDNKNRKLNYCIEPNFAEYNHNNNLLYKNLVDKISDRLDTKIQLVNAKNKSEALDLVKQRKCDFIPLAIKTDDKKEYFDFTDSYMNSPYVLATLEKSLYVVDLQDVINKDIAIVKGQHINEFLKNKYPDKKFIEVQDVQEGLELLNNGFVFGFLDSLMNVAYEINANNYNDINISGTFEYGLDISIATRNDEPILNTIMNQVINDISKEDKKEIYNNWFNIDVTNRIDYDLFLRILIVLIFLIVIGFIWNLSIRNEKKNTLKSLDEVKKLKNDLLDKNKELVEQTLTDELTQLSNRRKTTETIEYELKRFRRTKNPFAVVLLDIDLFKKINDTHGHLIGDEVLKEFSRILQNTVRDSDIVGRWGGEEFIIIAPNTSVENANKLAEKLRKLIQVHDFNKAGKITASFGITESKYNDTKELIVDRADKALYTSKRTGRNKVIAFN